MYTVVASKKKSPTVVVSARIDAKTRQRLVKVMKSRKVKNLSETVKWAIRYCLDRLENER